MINAENIGKRLRLLRKEKRVSQEKMAEDLGMYQADISNLERAMTGSGITDLYKLDMIADYFGIPLAELLGATEAPKAAPHDVEPAPESKMMEAVTVKDFKIDEVHYKSKDFCFASEVRLVIPDKQDVYYSFFEEWEKPHFYKSTTSMFIRLTEAFDNIERLKEVNEQCFLYGDDYVDIFEKADEEIVGLLRYLIFVGTEDEESVKELIKQTKGQVLGEIDVPIPSREPEELFNVDYTDLRAIFRYRLMVETAIKNPCVYDDLDDVTRKQEQSILKKLKEACASEEAYKVWKKDLIDERVKEIEKDCHLIRVKYVFAGIGQYDDIIPEEELDCFKCWIQGNGAAIFCGSTPATKKDIRRFVSQHIADDLLFS